MPALVAALRVEARARVPDHAGRLAEVDRRADSGRLGPAPGLRNERPRRGRVELGVVVQQQHVLGAPSERPLGAGVHPAGEAAIPLEPHEVGLRERRRHRVGAPVDGGVVHHDHVERLVLDGFERAQAGKRVLAGRSRRARPPPAAAALTAAAARAPSSPAAAGSPRAPAPAPRSCPGRRPASASAPAHGRRRGARPGAAAGARRIQPRLATHQRQPSTLPRSQPSRAATATSPSSAATSTGSDGEQQPPGVRGRDEDQPVALHQRVLVGVPPVVVVVQHVAGRVEHDTQPAHAGAPAELEILVVGEQLIA